MSPFLWYVLPRSQTICIPDLLYHEATILSIIAVAAPDFLAGKSGDVVRSL